MTSEHDLVHLVGSVPLKTTEDVFRTLSAELGQYLRRIPDGETGERIKWIVFQQKMLHSHPDMELDPAVPPLLVKNWDGKVHREIGLLRMKSTSNPEEVQFDTGYDTAAIESYAVFRSMRESGTIPAEVRFQIALPTPMATGLMYVSPVGRERYLEAYERALMRALARILGRIPPQDLAIQFDVCQEVLMVEGYFAENPDDLRDAFFQQFRRLGAAVPERAELGFHLCFGSPGDENLVRPGDAGHLVALLNDIGSAVQRPLDFVHIPVPRSFADNAFLLPLKKWKRRDETQLYLGLIAWNDPPGNAHRIASAKRIIDEFGIASECGWGRTDPARLPAIFESHRRAAELVLAR